MLWKLSYFSEGVPIQAIVAATLRLLLPCIMPFQLCFHFLHQVRFPFWLPTTLFLLFPMIFHLFFPMSFLIALSLLTFFISFFFSRSASSKPDPISPYLKKKKKRKNISDESLLSLLVYKEQQRQKSYAGTSYKISLDFISCV